MINNTFNIFMSCSLEGSPIPPSLPPNSNQDLYFAIHANCSSIVIVFSLGRVFNRPLK